MNRIKHVLETANKKALCTLCCAAEDESDQLLAVAQELWRRYGTVYGVLSDAECAACPQVIRIYQRLSNHEP